MVELREVLKHWDEFKDEKGNDLVKFVDKGKILKADDLKTKLADWQKRMTEANREADRAQAPPRENFAKQLNSIDPELLKKIPKGKEGDKDARDIVRKSGYLEKVAKTRPEIVLNYILNSCDVLIQYGLISDKLPDAAKRRRSAQEGNEIRDASKQVLDEIKKCNASFQGPLEAALVHFVQSAFGEKI